jgi:hypothetical protein
MKDHRNLTSLEMIAGVTALGVGVLAIGTGTRIFINSCPSTAIPLDWYYLGLWITSLVVGAFAIWTGLWTLTRKDN